MARTKLGSSTFFTSWHSQKGIRLVHWGQQMRGPSCPRCPGAELANAPINAPLTILQHTSWEAPLKSTQQRERTQQPPCP